MRLPKVKHICYSSLYIFWFPLLAYCGRLVDLGYAKYQGITIHAGIDQFLGMRFAASPVGDLRWRAPQDPVLQNGIQSAIAFGPLCFGPGSYGSGTSEDCLFVNVFKPANATAKSKLPVWVYIQGGGYAQNSNANYDGTDVIVNSGKEIVFVNLNYRVGSLGFLASEAVRRDGDLNAGLLDQRKALEWVQKYITKFGGDPNHVVIHGSSAGAGSIVYQLAAYGGRDDGLFVGGVSNSPFFPWHPKVPELEGQFDTFARNLSCAANQASSVMNCLRAKSTDEIAGSTVILPFSGTTGPPNFYWLPVVDGIFSQDTLYNALEHGKFVKVPVLVGNDYTEGNGFATNAATSDEFLAYMQDTFPRLTKGDLSKINNTYQDLPLLPQHKTWFPATALAYGDSTFTCPGNQIAESIARYVGPDKVFNYLYNVTDRVAAASGNAVPHTAETQAVFGVDQAPNAAACDNCSFASYNAPIVPVVQHYWISFVKHLDPNPEKYRDAPRWNSWGTGRARRIQFALNATHDEAVPEGLLARCGLWRELAATTEQ